MHTEKRPTRIAIFASGTGSNAKKIIEHFQHRKDINVALVVSNRPSAGVLKIAEAGEIPSKVLLRRDFTDEALVLGVMDQYKIDFIVLAGFLLLVPIFLVRKFQHRMLNIHPALLPKFGGKGMYGMHVHEAVKEAREKESGMTIHFVNEKYDEGAIVFQAKTEIHPDDSPQDIADKVLVLEHQYYPKVVDACIQLLRTNDEEE